MKKMIRFGYLPISTPCNSVARQSNEIPRSRVFPLREKSIHSIPVLVLICFLTLCWFSHPVDLVIKDGKIMVTHDTVGSKVLAHLDHTQTGLARLKFASSPIPSVLRDLNDGDGTEAQVSLHVKQLVYHLLNKDPKNRLGSCEGANEIKQHPFFKGINWALVRSMNPPQLDAPLFPTEPGKEDKILDPELQDLQINF